MILHYPPWVQSTRVFYIWSIFVRMGAYVLLLIFSLTNRKEMLTRFPWTCFKIRLLSTCFRHQQVPVDGENRRQHGKRPAHQGIRLLHASGRVQGRQRRFADAAQLPDVQDVLLPFWQLVHGRRWVASFFSRYFSRLPFLTFGYIHLAQRQTAWLGPCPRCGDWQQRFRVGRPGRSLHDRTLDCQNLQSQRSTEQGRLSVLKWSWLERRRGSPFSFPCWTVQNRVSVSTINLFIYFALQCLQRVESASNCRIDSCCKSVVSCFPFNPRCIFSGSIWLRTFSILFNGLKRSRNSVNGAEGKARNTIEFNYFDVMAFRLVDALQRYLVFVFISF